MTNQKMGVDGHVLTFPVNSGRTANVVAFRTTSDDWLDYPKLTRRATREDALRDFASFNPTILGLLKLTNPDLDVVSCPFLEQRDMQGPKMGEREREKEGLDGLTVLA